MFLGCNLSGFNSYNKIKTTLSIYNPSTMSGVGEESIRRITKTQEALMRRWAGVRGPNDQSDIMKNLLILGQVSVFAKV